jgi:hypothetical protein
VFWLLAVGCWLLAVGCSDTSAGPERSEGLVLNSTKEVDADTNPWDRWSAVLAVGCWLLAFGCWLLAFGFWLLAFGFWLLADGFWLLTVQTSPQGLSAAKAWCSTPPRK